MSDSSQDDSAASAETRRRLLRPRVIVRRVRPGDNYRNFLGYAANISSGGLFISATVPRRPGDRFQVEIPLPQPLSRDLRCTCEVVWSRAWSEDPAREPGMGVRFLDLPDEDADAIGRWAARAYGG